MENSSSPPLIASKSSKTKNLLLKMNFLSHILCYYGYVDQSQAMMISLSNLTRQVYFKNLQVLFKVIFQDPRYFWEAKFKSYKWTTNNLKYLKVGNKHTVCRWGYTLYNAEVLKAFVELLNDTPVLHNNMFDRIRYAFTC